jgi:flavin-dependent dehydrogenase
MPHRCSGDTGGIDDQRMYERFDIIIVGGRCAGGALARITASAGIRTLVLDRAAFPSDTVSSHAISTHGVELLDAWGLLDAVLATGAPQTHSFRVTAGDFDTTVTIPSEQPGMIAPRRTVLDHLLISAAREAGAVVWESTTFLGVVTGPNGLVTGVRCRKAERELEVSAAMVVGADGFRSAVAQAVAAPSYDVRPSSCAGVYAYYEEPATGEFSLALGERRLLLALPTNDGQTCVAFACHSDDFGELHRGGDRAWQGVADEVAPAIGQRVRQGRRASRFVVFKCPPGRFRRPFGPGWALVGDAGHYTDPFTGQGMGNAFLGAHLLGSALVDGFSGGTNLEDSLAHYQHERDRLTGEIHALTHDLAGFDWDVPAGTAALLRRRELGDRLHREIAAMVRGTRPVKTLAPASAGAA